MMRYMLGCALALMSLGCDETKPEIVGSILQVGAYAQATGNSYPQSDFELDTGELFAAASAKAYTDVTYVQEAVAWAEVEADGIEIRIQHDDWAESWDGNRLYPGSYSTAFAHVEAYVYVPAGVPIGPRIYHDNALWPENAWDFRITEAEQDYMYCYRNSELWTSVVCDQILSDEPKLYKISFWFRSQWEAVDGDTTLVRAMFISLTGEPRSPQP